MAIEIQVSLHAPFIPWLRWNSSQ